MGNLNVQDPQANLRCFWNINNIKRALTLDSTEGMMVIGRAYMTLPLVSNGTSHTEDDMIKMYSQLADTVQWQISILFCLFLSQKHIAAGVHVPQKAKALQTLQCRD
jgi:hypothetical protein